jgi:hypothetical protein
MKKIYLLALVSIVLFSCSKNSEQIDISKSEIEKRMSDIEKKDIKYTCIEISDREAYSEILKYHQKKYDFAESYYEKSRCQKLIGNDLAKLASLKGLNTYYKVIAIKTMPDTIHHTKTYLDNNNKIIITQYLK